MAAGRVADAELVSAASGLRSGWRFDRRAGSGSNSRLIGTGSDLSTTLWLGLVGLAAASQNWSKMTKRLSCGTYELRR